MNLALALTAKRSCCSKAGKAEQCLETQRSWFNAAGFGCRKETIKVQTRFSGQQIDGDFVDHRCRLAAQDVHPISALMNVKSTSRPASGGCI